MYVSTISPICGIGQLARGVSPCMWSTTTLLQPALVRRHAACHVWRGSVCNRRQAARSTTFGMPIDRQVERLPSPVVRLSGAGLSRATAVGRPRGSPRPPYAVALGFWRAVRSIRSRSGCTIRRLRVYLNWGASWDGPVYMAVSTYRAYCRCTGAACYGRCCTTQSMRTRTSSTTPKLASSPARSLWATTWNTILCAGGLRGHPMDNPLCYLRSAMRRASGGRCTHTPLCQMNRADDKRLQLLADDAPGLTPAAAADPPLQPG